MEAAGRDSRGFLLFSSDCQYADIISRRKKARTLSYFNEQRGGNVKLFNIFAKNSAV